MFKKLLCLKIVYIEPAIIITVFKDNSFNLKIEYYLEDDKIKEKNYNLDKDMVIKLFNRLQRVVNQYFGSIGSWGDLKVYYGQDLFVDIKIDLNDKSCLFINEIVDICDKYVDESYLDRIKFNISKEILTQKIGK